MFIRFITIEKIIILFFAWQIILWSYTNDLKPVMEIIPNPPGYTEIEALSLGDEQLYFRTKAIELQSFGDGFGRFSALKDYDYSILVNWFYLLDHLDNKSNFAPSIASYYYSQTQKTSDLIYIIEYLEKNYDLDPEKKWWWLAQSVYIANHKYGDKRLALRLAEKLAKTPGSIPIWAKEMPAFIHEQLGEKQEALIIIRNLLENKEALSKEEINFMDYFINERLNRIIKENDR